MTEDDAVLRCQHGDRDAFRYFVDRYKDALYGTAYMITGNQSLAEEQVQEAFLNAWRGIRGFKRGRPFKPWLMRVLVNAVTTQRRRQLASTVVKEEPGRAAYADGPEGTADAREDRQTIRQALLGLPTEQRQVVVLRYFCGLTLRQVAASMGIKEGMVKSRLQRAHQQLGERLQEIRGGQVDDDGL